MTSLSLLGSLARKQKNQLRSNSFIFVSASAVLISVFFMANAVNAAPVLVTGVTLNQHSATLTVGNTDQLVPTITPANATTKTVTYTSDTPAVATVNSSGLVTAVAAGSATITVRTDDRGFTDTDVLTVNPAPILVTGVTLNEHAATLTAGNTDQLVATITPANATTKTVTYISDTPAVATVNNSGLVTAVAAGSATITVRTTDGGFTDTDVLTVNAAPILVTGVTLNEHAANLTIGNTNQLVPTIAPADATTKTVTYASDASAVATVNSSGLVTAVAEGSAIITVRTTDGGFTDTDEITVFSGSLAYVSTACNMVVYGDWGACVDGLQYRNVLSQSPNQCTITASQQATRTQSCSAAPVVQTPASATSTAAQNVVKVQVYANGTLLRGTDKRIYVVSSSTLIYIKDLKELAKYAGREILNVADSVIVSFPKTVVPEVQTYANGTLLRGSDKRIYVIVNGKKQYISSLKELAKYAGKEILNVADSVIAQY